MSKSCAALIYWANRSFPSSSKPFYRGPSLITPIWPNAPGAERTQTVLSLQPKDTLLFNGQLLTMDAQMSVQQAIAIRDTRIQAVGDNETLRAAAQADTHIIDLQGRTVIPGIIDVHAHLDREGLKNLQPGLEGVRSIVDILDMIKREVSMTAPGEWVVTMPIGDRPNYADMPERLAEKRFPTRWDLDTVSPDHPVYIRGI